MNPTPTNPRIAEAAKTAAKAARKLLDLPNLGWHIFELSEEQATAIIVAAMDEVVREAENRASDEREAANMADMERDHLQEQLTARDAEVARLKETAGELCIVSAAIIGVWADKISPASIADFKIAERAMLATLTPPPVEKEEGTNL